MALLNKVGQEPIIPSFQSILRRSSVSEDGSFDLEAPRGELEAERTRQAVSEANSLENREETDGST